MTWLKLSDSFDDDCSNADLSDAAFRTHVQGLLWAMRRETGGWLTERAVRKFPDTDAPEQAVQELCDAGFWRRADGGYQVIHHMEWQPTPDVLAARREADAARQAKARDRKAHAHREKAAEDDPSHHESRRDTDPTIHVTTGRAGAGRNGPGREGLPPPPDSTGDNTQPTSVPPPRPEPALVSTIPGGDCGWCRGSGCVQCDPGDYS